MDFKAVMYLKTFFDNLAGVCDTIDAKQLWDDPSECGIKLKDIFKSDIAEFLLYLSASDGAVVCEEVQMYQVVTGYDVEQKDLHEYIITNHIYSEGFESSVPLIIKLVSESEQKAMSGEIRFEKSESLTEHFAKFFVMIGDLLIGIDGKKTPSEKRDLEIYMNTIRRYVSTNCDSMQEYYDYIDGMLLLKE